MNNTENNQSEIRTLKVYDKILDRGGRLAFGYSVLFPEIRLTGRWLENCGFRPGQYIKVISGQNKLIITPAWFDDEGRR